jgi:methylenetetrahydrofolate dehydrogenase (NAD+)
VPTRDYRLPTTWVRPQTVVVNVSSFANVDEAALLAVPGVRYVPLVGRVTVAMLERNLLRLYENFHKPNAQEDAITA